ncbi:hypothetical protein [Skermania piniformis]|uniref:Transcriptional regulator n=1 Tax=Skermania pinensis TaxID=39122 RepID=A0ABX8SAA9_9ACTN|nr:hypothetical protein [Skermania piniformis]QXQ14793.1 hypothetical protein KV203_05250 [Skermania piniformis]
MSTSIRLRATLLVLVLAVAGGCLALGWWQWSRFEAVGGTAQNLGYALQWPLFAGFAVYTYRRFVQLERGHRPRAADTAPEPAEIPADLLPPRPTAPSSHGDPVRDEYNRYLAELYLADLEPDRRLDDLSRDPADRSTP